MQLNTNLNTASILVIGAGRMGSAIIKGWVDSGIDPKSVHVVDNNDSLVEQLQQALAINAYNDISHIEANKTFEVILVALKPQVISHVLPLYRSFFAPNALLLSIAAGVTCEQLGQLSPEKSAIIRIMPNTPLLIKKGVIAALSNGNTSTSQKALCEALFNSLGAFHWLQNEDQMHAVTAISGSGPAYLFYFAETFSQAASELGLAPLLAKQLALETLIGASYLVENDPREVSELRQEVTSPNGTTAAALDVLSSEESLLKLLKGTLRAASDRSKALAQNL